MILATHAVIGAAVASAFPQHPVVAFCFAFASHFVFDAIPHWHYPVASIHHDRENPMNNDMVIGTQFVGDLAKIACDALLGIAISLVAFGLLVHIPLPLILLGAVGGIVPDTLQFAYWKFRHEPIKSLQRLHVWVHAKTTLDQRPFIGIASQVGIALLAIVAGLLIAV